MWLIRMSANASADKLVKSMDRQARGSIVNLVDVYWQPGMLSRFTDCCFFFFFLLEYSTSIARIISGFDVSSFDGLCELAPVLRYKIH